MVIKISFCENIHNLWDHSLTDGHYFRVCHYKQGYNKYSCKHVLCTSSFMFMGWIPRSEIGGEKGMWYLLHFNRHCQIVSKRLWQFTFLSQYRRVPFSLHPLVFTPFVVIWSFQFKNILAYNGSKVISHCSINVHFPTIINLNSVAIWISSFLNCLFIILGGGIFLSLFFCQFINALFVL